MSFESFRSPVDYNPKMVILMSKIRLINHCARSIKPPFSKAKFVTKNAFFIFFSRLFEVYDK